MGDRVDDRQTPFRATAPGERRGRGGHLHAVAHRPGPDDFPASNPALNPDETAPSSRLPRWVVSLLVLLWRHLALHGSRAPWRWLLPLVPHIPRIARLSPIEAFALAATLAERDNNGRIQITVVVEGEGPVGRISAPSGAHAGRALWGQLLVVARRYIQRPALAHVRRPSPPCLQRNPRGHHRSDAARAPDADGDDAADPPPPPLARSAPTSHPSCLARRKSPERPRSHRQLAAVYALGPAL